MLLPTDSTRITRNGSSDSVIMTKASEVIIVPINAKLILIPRSLKNPKKPCGTKARKS